MAARQRQLGNTQVRIKVSEAEQVAAADRAAILVFRVITPKQAARLLSVVVRRSKPQGGQILANPCV